MMARRRVNRSSRMSCLDVRVLTLACLLLLLSGNDLGALTLKSMASAAFMSSQAQRKVSVVISRGDYHRHAKGSLHMSLDEKHETSRFFDDQAMTNGDMSMNGMISGDDDELVMVQQLTKEMEKYIDWVNQKDVLSTTTVATNGESSITNHDSSLSSPSPTIEVSHGTVQADLLAKIAKLESKLAKRQDDSSGGDGGVAPPEEEEDDDGAADTQFALEEVQRDLDVAKSNLEQAEETIKVLETIEQDLLFAVTALEEAAVETKSLHQEELDQLQHAKNYLQYALSDKDETITSLEEEISKQENVQDLYQVLYATHIAKTQQELQVEQQLKFKEHAEEIEERRQADNELMKKESEEKQAALKALEDENNELNAKIESLKQQSKFSIIAVQETKVVSDQEDKLRAELEHIKEKLSSAEAMLEEQSSKTVQQEETPRDSGEKEKELNSMVEQMKLEQAQLFDLMARLEGMSQYHATHLEQSMEKVKEENASSQSKVSELETTLQSTKEELEAVSRQREIQDRQFQLEQKQVQEQYSKEIKDLKESIQQQEGSITSSDTTVKGLETKQKELAATISTLEASVKRKELEVQKEQSNFKKEQMKFEKEMSAKDREIKASQRTITSLEQKGKQLMDKVSMMETTIKEEKQSKIETSRALDSSKKELNQAQSKIAQLEQQLAKAREDVTRTNERNINNSKKDVIPEINQWVLTERGEIRGKVSKHPTMRNLEEIMTSVLANPELAKANSVVETTSGSLYRLRNPDPSYARKANTSSSAAATVSPPVKNTPFFTSPSNKVPSLKIPSFQVPGVSPSKSVPEEEVAASESQVIDYELNGETIGNGKYLLSGKPIPTKNKRTSTMKAYLAGPDMKPRGDPVIVKLSNNEENMQREHTNYQRLWSGVKRGLIVKCHDYFPDIDSKQSHKSSCALVLERGTQDLKQFLHFQPQVDDEIIKDALFSVARCMSGIHAARYVWTDLKTENFVAIEDFSRGKMNFKAIDMESAVPCKGHPIDYTPEACPPEFAKAFVAKEPHSFVLEYSYDVWSFGMMALELSTGSGYFPDNLRWDAIIKRVAALESIDVDALVSDEPLADLISKCLAVDPSQRISSNMILKHPYFRGVGRPGGLFGSW